MWEVLLTRFILLLIIIVPKQASTTAKNTCRRLLLRLLTKHWESIIYLKIQIN